MANNKTFLMITAIVNREYMGEVPVYLGNIMPIFAKNGGKPYGRFKTIKHLSGDDNPEMVGIIEFPSAEIISEVVNSEGLQKPF